MKKDHFSILIIDDDQKIIDLITTFLKIKYPKFVVVSATDPREGQMKMDNQDFDVVIVDQFMGTKTGLDIITYAKKTLKHANRKFILMSGGLQTPEVARAINLGVTEILVKPFPLLQLQEKILKFI